MINCEKNEELRKFKQVVYYMLCLLLEAGDTRNNDKAFIYCKTLSVLIKIILKANEMYLITQSKLNKIEKVTKEVIESVKAYILNEEYLNYKFED